MIEVHPRPAEAFSDGPKSLKPHKFAALVAELRPYLELMGQKVS